MKITGGHPKKLNDPIIGHPAMKGRRWMIDYGAEPHSSYGKLSKKQVDEFAVANNDTYTDTRHNDVDIGYTEFYDELDPYQNPIDKTDYTVDVDIEDPHNDDLNEKNDRCTRIAKRKYKKWPSAYASGAVVKCRQGKIWKGVSEEVDEAFDKEKKQGLHGWFARRGGKGGKGWVDCNTCRTNPKTGRKTCKACGRQAGETRSKYPACRPTPGQCTKTGTSHKKGPSTVSWKPKKESMEINEASQTGGIITGTNPQGRATKSSGTAQASSPTITTGYGASKAPIQGTGEEVERKGAYDFFQYKKDNAQFGNGNIIKSNGRVSLKELAQQVIDKLNEQD